jgi:hypothetical protein
MKHWLTAIFIVLAQFLFAQQTQPPQYEFRSTSSYQYTTIQHQYTVPVAAKNIDPYNNHSKQNIGPRRENVSSYEWPPNPNDPFIGETPVGDPDIFTIAFLLLLYFGCQYLKNRKSQMLLLNIQKQ